MSSSSVKDSTADLVELCTLNESSLPWDGGLLEHDMGECVAVLALSWRGIYTVDIILTD